jgi:enamine deaminase RidA (YjgF/YER057c/UK114 family)
VAGQVALDPATGQAVLPRPDLLVEIRVVAAVPR